MILEAFSPFFQSKNSNVLSDNGGFFGFMGGATSKSGASVTANSALTLSAFYNGIEILSNDYAKMPKGVFKNDNGNRTKERNHPVHSLISKRPNNLMSAFMMDKMLIQYAILRGNGYAEIVRNDYTAAPESLQLINQYKTPVKVVLSSGKLWYHFNDRKVPADNIIHIPGFSFNGITGISLVKFAANSLGIGLSSNEFAADYYKTKGQGTILLTAHDKMTAEAKVRYADGLRNHLTKGDQVSVAIVDEMKGVQNIKFTPQEAMLLETNQAVVLEAARFLNIPPHKLKHLDGANYSNMESQNIGHLSDSVLPWSIKSKQEYEYKLFSKTELADGYYINHNTGILLQADKKTQAEYYSRMIMAGAMTRAEVREKEDLNAIEGLEQPLIPVNLQTLEQLNLNVAKTKKELNAA